MIPFGIIGHTGRLGEPLYSLLTTNHPEAKIVYTQSRGMGENGNFDDAKFMFLALPKGESKNYMEKCKGKRVIDLSEDYRGAPGWVYGLPELNMDEIRTAQRVANPGCYATSIIMALAPIATAISNVCISSTSGISGAGLKVESVDNFRVYKEGKIHQHIPEIERALGLQGILFVPQCIHTADRGIVSTIFSDYNGPKNLNEIFSEFYQDKPFIRIKEGIETKNVNRTNYCDIKPMLQDGKILIISALDNTIKGGSGQAVQNFNIMNGFPETLGLI